jgi:hypothetical protein
MATQSIKKIYLDQDGVLSDFERQLQTHNISPDLPRVEFWEKVQKTPKFWISMPLMPGARNLVDYLKKYEIPIEILTSPAKDPKCRPGKLVWLRAHGFNFPVHFSRAQNKVSYASPDTVLIDDKLETIEAWNKAGGIGILHKNVGDTMRELEQYINERK